jgi:hypothetical protein
MQYYSERITKYECGNQDSLLVVAKFASTGDPFPNGLLRARPAAAENLTLPLLPPE